MHLRAKYNQLLADVEHKPYYKNTQEQKGLTNSYLCSACGNTLEFYYVDTGCTPFAIRCPYCKTHNMQSNFLRENYPRGRVDYEWYRPSLKEFLQLKPPMMRYVLHGGLLKREVSHNKSCIWELSDVDTNMYETGCGNGFLIQNGTPKDNEMNCCCYCGLPLQEST